MLLVCFTSRALRDRVEGLFASVGVLKREEEGVARFVGADVTGREVGWVGREVGWIGREVDRVGRLAREGIVDRSLDPVKREVGVALGALARAVMEASSIIG